MHFIHQVPSSPSSLFPILFLLFFLYISLKITRKKGKNQHSVRASYVSRTILGEFTCMTQFNLPTTLESGFSISLLQMKKPSLLRSSELLSDTPRVVKVMRLLTNCATLVNCSFTLIPNKELLAYILYVLDDQRSTGHGTPSPWQQHHLPGLWHGTLLVECRCRGEMLCSRMALPSV